MPVCFINCTPLTFYFILKCYKCSIDELVFSPKFGGRSMMAFYRHSSDMLTERRGILGMIFKSLDQSEHGFRVVRRGRRLCRITRQRLSRWVFVLALLFLIYFVVSGVQMLFHGEIQLSFTIFYLIIFL